MTTYSEFHDHLLPHLTRINTSFLLCRNQEGNQVDNQVSNQAINQGIRNCYQKVIPIFLIYHYRPLGEPTHRPMGSRRSRPAPTAHHYI